MSNKQFNTIMMAVMMVGAYATPGGKDMDFFSAFGGLFFAVGALCFWTKVFILKD